MRGKSALEGKEILFLGEEDYMDKMLHIVRPFLEENRRTGYFQSFDGARIYYEYYDNPKEKATVVISHGLCEFSKKFEEVIFYFLQEGYSIYILEHRGHGYSQRFVQNKSKVYIRSYDEYVLDLHRFMTQIVLKAKTHENLVLYAHSMGGAIAALFLKQYPDIFSCAILSSPMLEINCGKTPVIFVWSLMIYKKLVRSDKDYLKGHGSFDGVPNFEASSCLSEARYNDIFTKRLHDENCQTYGASCAWMLASLVAVHKINKNAKRIKTPILLFQAGNDTSVKSGGQNRFVAKSRKTKLVVMPGSRHEIYNANTVIRKEYYQKVFAFIEEIIIRRRTHL